MRFSRCRYFFVLSIALLIGPYLRADVTGALRGYVRDKSGAVVPNATVTALSTSNGYTRTATSDTAGLYSLLALPPGNYKLTASSTGFEKQSIENIVLNVNDVLNYDFTLPIGNVSQTVSVDANAVQVETASTSQGTTITSQQILSMPLNGRSYLDLLALQPGVSPTNTNSGYNDRSPSSGLYGSSGNVSTDGMPEGGNSFLVNGAEVNETKNMGAGLIPDADSVAEFRLITNSFSAEYGKFTGSVMNTLTKSGTNSLHGTLFEFYRNQKMDATNYFDSSKAELKRHQYGGVLGAPIWKDRLFSFTDFQQTRQVAGVSTGVVQVLSNDERNGIFSDSILNTPVQGDGWAAKLQARGGGVVHGSGGTCAPPNCTPTLYNQLGTAVMTTDSNGNSVPGHNISGYMDPVSKAYLPLIPQSNQAGGFDYDDSSHKGSIIDTNMAERIDFINHKTGDWAFYYHYDDATALNPVYNQQYFGQENVPGFPTMQPSRNQLFTASNTRTIGATTVNVARISFFRTSEHTAQPSASSSIASYGDYGFNTDPANGGLINTGPSGYITSVPSLFFNSFTVGNNWLNLYQPDTNYSVGDTVSKTVQNHSLSFGGDFRYYQLNARNACGPNGYFSFSGQETGADVSDFFIGAPGQFVQCSVQFLDNRTNYWAIFGEDSWKASPNLTINYGIRWDVARPWSDKYGRLTAPVPGQQSVKFPNSPAGNVVPGDPGVPSTISPTRYTNIGPRIGIAWAPSGGIWGEGKTSVRAAYGVYYLGVADNGNFGILGDAPWGLYWSSPQQTEFDSPYVTRSTGVSQGQHFPFQYPEGSGPFPNFQFGNLMPLYLPGYYNKNKTMAAQHFNLSVQRQLDKATVLTVSYVGTLGHHIEHSVNIMYGDSALCQSLAGCGPGGEGGVYTRDGQTVYGTLVGAIDNQTISPNYHNSNGGPVVAFAEANYLQNSGNSNYSSLQVALERRSRDLTFLVGYTYAKSMDTVGATYDPRTQDGHNYGYSTFDMRNNLVASYNWELPFYRFMGQHRYSTGWHVTGITRFNSGTPVSLASGGDFALTNIGLDYPTQVAPIKKLNPHNPGHNYFDTSSFASGLSCGYEVCGQSGTARQYLFHGPGTINTDAGVEKDTKITERTQLQFRIEMFNVFNHANFLTGATVGNANSGQFGQVTNTAPGRIGQISGKFIF